MSWNLNEPLQAQTMDRPKKDSAKRPEPQRDLGSVEAVRDYVRRLALRYLRNQESTESAMQMLRAIQGRRGRPA